MWRSKQSESFTSGQQLRFTREHRSVRAKSFESEAACKCLWSLASSAIFCYHSYSKMCVSGMPCKLLPKFKIYVDVLKFLWAWIPSSPVLSPQVKEGKSRPRLVSRSTKTHTEPSAANGQSIGKQHQNPLLSVHDISPHKNKATIKCLYHTTSQQSQDTPQRVA